MAGELLDVARVRQAAGSRTGPLVVAVDGRGAGGKSTVADRLAEVVGGAVVVHTDDVAWHHGFFDWDGLLLEGILGPLSRGDDVAFRPPAWVERGREGEIAVPALAAVLLVEGVGSSREALTPWLDAAVWVQSDADEAYRRGIERDVAAGRNRAEALAFWDEWMAQEVPFLAADRPWERADLVVCSTPNEPVDGLLVSRARAGSGPPAPRTS
ncbi:MAG TPA: hypothetical protein VI110_16265 [Lapillicoccus sp.]